MRNKDNSNKLMRWSLKIQEYDIEIKHRKGKENKVADALSRNLEKDNTDSPDAKIYNIMKKRKLSDEFLEDGKVDVVEENNVNEISKTAIISEMHINLGHACARTTYDYLKKRYFWETMREDTLDVVKRCEECMKFNNKKSATSNYPLMIGEAFERIGIDLMGPFEITQAGNKFIVVAIDYLTKYIELDAIKDKNAETIANFLYEKIILIHGCPNTLLSDNGREFNNLIVKNLCDKMRITKKFSSPYRPQTNGLIERTNRTLISIISKYIHENKTTWDKCLQDIRFQYNIRPQENLGFSPFELVFGRSPSIPVMLHSSNRSEYPMERNQRINKRQEDVMRKKRVAQRKARRIIDTKVKIGDVVLYKNLHKANKFDEKWIGPYIVVNVSKSGSFKLKNMKNNDIVVSHWSNIKPMYSDKEYKKDVLSVDYMKRVFEPFE